MEYETQEAALQKTHAELAARTANRTAVRADTPIDHAIERVRGLENLALELTARLNHNADAVMGAVPEANDARGTLASSGQVGVSSGALFNRLSDVLSDAEVAMSRLSEAAGRNCWAA